MHSRKCRRWVPMWTCTSCERGAASAPRDALMRWLCRSIRKNRVSSLRAGCFDTNLALETLDLSLNTLSGLDHGVFDQLTQLSTL